MGAAAVSACEREQQLRQTIHAIGTVMVIYVNILPPPCLLSFRSKEMPRRETETTAKVLAFNQPTAVDLVEELLRLQVDVEPAGCWEMKTTKIRLVGNYYDNYHVPCFFGKKQRFGNRLV